MQSMAMRQVHLDFHTSERIPRIGAEFDPAEFADAVSAAGINSMTVFARCHHGWLYYPSKEFPERVHPELSGRNLMQDQITALHRKGIRAPVYITIQWDAYTAERHPEWLIRKPGGTHEGGSFMEPGFYQSLCVNTPYADFLLRQTREVVDLLGDELDGLFFDITGIRPCWCSACREGMRQQGIDMMDETAVRAYAKANIDAFKRRMSDMVRSLRKDATLFYNAGHVGPCTKDSAESYSHFELESLPSGSWGYLHFPVTARYARTLGKPCLGMTGKFHTEWGDFHSLKNQAALEFECFRMISYGFSASIGDQLEPCGKLNPATYRLIGNVFHAIEEREAWAVDAKALIEAALLTPENPLCEHEIPASILGACQMLEELGLQFDVIDPEMSYEGYPLLILPDDCALTSEQQSRLDTYVANGGKVIACKEGGLYDGKYPSSFGAKYLGDAPFAPDFILADGPLAAGLEQGNEYVIYQKGARIEPDGGSEALSARAPYFNREGRSFCSHRYTPSAKRELYPAAVQSKNVLLLSHPLFGQYRHNAPNWCKRLIANALDLLLPNRLVRHNGPSTLSITLLEQPEQSRVNAHILSYVPVRKSATIDIIEERTQVNDLSLQIHLPHPPVSARLVPQNIPLPIHENKITVPQVDGYAIVEINYEARQI